MEDETVGPWPISAFGPTYFAAAGNESFKFLISLLGSALLSEEQLW
jgi:hypothetical protein